MKTSTPLALAGMAFLLAACASIGDRDNVHGLPDIETRAAQGIDVDVNVNRGDGVWVVYGEVRKRPDHRGRVPGHVDLTLLDAEGSVLVETVKTYRHPSRRSHYSWFIVELADPGEKAVSLRVSHHKSWSEHSTT